MKNTYYEVQSFNYGFAVVDLKTDLSVEVWGELEQAEARAAMFESGTHQSVAAASHLEKDVFPV